MPSDRRGEGILFQTRDNNACQAMMRYPKMNHNVATVSSNREDDIALVTHAHTGKLTTYSEK